MKLYTKKQVVEAIYREAKSWENRAYNLLEFDPLDDEYTTEEIEERNHDYQEYIDWAKCLNMVAFEIEHTDILK